MGKWLSHGESVDEHADHEVVTHPWWKVVWLTIKSATPIDFMFVFLGCIDQSDFPTPTTNNSFYGSTSLTQVAMKLLPSILRSDVPFKVKAEAFFHLTPNISYPLMILSAR